MLLTGLTEVGFDYLNQRVKEALVEFVSAVVREKFLHLSNEKVSSGFGVRVNTNAIQCP